MPEEPPRPSHKQSVFWRGAGKPHRCVGRANGLMTARMRQEEASARMVIATGPWQAPARRDRILSGAGVYGLFSVSHRQDERKPWCTELSADNFSASIQEAALQICEWTSALTVHQRSEGWERAGNPPDMSASQGVRTVSSVTFFPARARPKPRFATGAGLVAW